VQSRVAVSTFLFTDVEGSSRLWEQEPLRMSQAMARHDAVLAQAVEHRRGVVVKKLGDGIHAAFDDPLDAIEAALAIQLALIDPGATDGIALKVRCGVHAGIVEARDDDFFGNVVNRAARIMGTAHGGQVIVSRTVADLVRQRLSAPLALLDLGTLRLRDLAAPEPVYQLVHPRLRQHFPPLRALVGTPTNLPRPLTSFVLTSSVPRPSTPVDSCGTRGSENARRTTRGQTSSSGSNAAVGQTSGSGSKRIRNREKSLRVVRTSVGFRCS